MIKKMKKILLVFMFILIMMIGTQKSYAGFLGEKYFNETNPYSGTFSLLIDDLEASWNMLCNNHGGPFPSSNSINSIYRTTSVLYGRQGSIDEFKNVISGQTGDTNTYKGTYYSDNTPAYTLNNTTIYAEPKTAYILNYMEEALGSSYKKNDGSYTDIQKAWYGVIGQKMTSHIFEEAKAYQNFVQKIADKNNMEDRSHTFEDGTKITIKFPKVNTNKINSMLTFNTVGKNNEIEKTGSSWAQNVTVSYDQERQKYLIGPFSIHYIESSSNGVNFGAIKGFDIYTDASSKPLNNNQWKFVWLNNNRKEFKYPHKDEIFYIEMDYIENATMITGIDVDYQYLIAGAEYHKMTGKFDKSIWETEKETHTTIDSEGNETTTYTWKLVNHDKIYSIASQELVFADKAARWYETAKISLRANQGTLEVEKKAIDENGNELTADQIKEKFGDYQYADFRIFIKHSTGEVETNDVTVRVGTSLITGPYTWDDKEDTPTYEVQEIPNQNWKLVSKENEKGTLKQGKKVTATFVNTPADDNQGEIKLTKKRSGNTDKEENFKFYINVILPNGEPIKDEAYITIPQGQETGNTWTKKYDWYGEKNATYEIIEDMEYGDAPLYPNSTINPAKGEIGKNIESALAEADVNALNWKVEEHTGFLQFKKELADGQATDEEFIFKVKVEGSKNDSEFEVALKAEESSDKYKYIWEGDVAPTYTIEEISNSEVKNITIEVTGGSNSTVNGNKVTGQLAEGEETEAVTKFVNNMIEHKGKVKVVKEIQTSEKLSKETLEKDGAKFEIEVVIAGTFVYKGETIQNSTKVISKKLPDDGKWEFTTDEIKWYGSKAPTFTVTEKNLPTGWICKTISYDELAEADSSSEGRSLIDGKTITATVTNELPVDEKIDLTFTMAGLVWVDNVINQKDQDDYNNQSNGVYDKGKDTLKENAEVTVYRVIYDRSGKEVSRSVATAYKDSNNNEIQFPLITKADGKWNVPRISVPAFTEAEIKNGYSSANGNYITYDVEFAYDGQTYEPVEFLSYKVTDNAHEKNTGSTEARAKAYQEASKTEKKKYFKDSMAIETNNNSNLITEVSGKTAMDANGNTTGIVTWNGEQKEITYSSDNAGAGYPVLSKVNTTDSNGRVLDIFKATANTSAGNLTYPFNMGQYNQDDSNVLGISIATEDKTIDQTALAEVSSTLDEKGVHKKYKFVAVYNYCKNINLGLKERAKVDIGLTKKLDNAKVVVKEKLYQYNYSGLYDLTEEKQESLAKSICTTGETQDIKLTLGLYKSDYYYRAEMYNASNDKTVYDALTDFYSSILKRDISDTEMDIYLSYNIELANNSSKYDVVINSLDDYYESNLELVRAEESKYLKTQTIGGKEQEVNNSVKVADASDYQDKWTDVKTGIAGSDGVTYNKMTASGLGIKLAPDETKTIKMTFKVNKKDSKSAKNAIVLGQKCNVAEIGSYSSYYAGTEKNAGKIDRDSAPSNINISANNTKSWYEDDTFAAPRINVEFTTGGDRTIEGIAWEDNSKDKNTENPGENQYVGDGTKQDHEKTIEGLTTELIEKVKVQNQDGSYTEYDFAWPTDKKLEALNGQTMNDISGFDSQITTGKDGKYTFANAPAGDYAVRFTYGDKEIESQDYSTSKYYNGQDYKSSKFASSLTAGETLKADSYLNIDNLTKDANTAVDSEVRRLEVVEKSREITFDNNKILAAANDEKYVDNKETLFEEYYMYAETPKIDINLERTDYNVNNDKEKKYKITEVNFGLEERPLTELSLDKQIEEIILTTSDGRNIMDAKYDIFYKVENGKITADVTLNKDSYGIDNLQALKRDDATNQGFRYVNVDSTILEGTTITVKYRFTVLNTGEVDRTGKLAEFDYTVEANKKLIEATENLSNEFVTYKKDGDKLVNDNDKELGEYVGKTYYYGKVDNCQDTIVTSTVRQLVDYIDNDVTFSGIANATKDTSWSNSTVDELSKMIDPSIIENGTIVDSRGIQYETDNRNNLVVSVDSYAVENSSLNNEGFIVELTPYEASAEKSQAFMNLTVTKQVGVDSDDLQIDNIAEIIKYNNTVGRRDELSVVGNQNPKAIEKLDEKEIEKADGGISAGYIGKVYERDTSATEVITLSPPTGSGLTTWKLQVLAVTTVGLAIIAGGIIFIKKKILK